MIVKDESHIILTTLENLISHLKFDYWVICDTGSTDNTCDLIESFFKEKSIPGELFHDQWVDFAKNRTLALDRAYNKTDYVLIFDADDSIVGDIVLPTNMDKHGYNLSFGSPGTSYSRMCLVKNNDPVVKWKYEAVLHEYITTKEKVDFTTETISGNYYIISGRLGARSKDPDKYIKDARVLEDAYYKAIKENDPLSNRYVYYCANSYLDANNESKAIEWYLKTLESFGWYEERYNACLKLFELYSKQNNKAGFYYLVRSIKYTGKRVECILELIKHYICEQEYSVAFTYYLLIQNYYENEYSTGKDLLSTKLFARTTDYTFFLPYYMIILTERMQKYELGINMYLIIFEKKENPGEWWIGNLLFNFKFFVNKVQGNLLKKIASSFKEYILHLDSIKINYNKNMLIELSKMNNTIKNTLKTIITETPEKVFNFQSTNTVLFFTGFSSVDWNYTYLQNNSIGGSETAVFELAKELTKTFNVIIAGQVGEEEINMNGKTLKFIHLGHLNDLLLNNKFKCIIISRYVSFFELYPIFNCNQLILMSHDTNFLNNVVGIDKSCHEIIQENNNKIDRCICLTEWHKQLYVKEYPCLENKIDIINNGIPGVPGCTLGTSTKLKNSFAYTSCSVRGLGRLLELWPEILIAFPDATLNIASYEDFPKDQYDMDLANKINILGDSVKHLGKLNKTDLYILLGKTEYWLYPCSFNETSCISCLEMLMCEVVCLYYPIAGLTCTLGDYGIQVSKGNEIDTLKKLTETRKTELRKNGLEYAKSCSWSNRGLLWKDKIYRIVFYAYSLFIEEMLTDYINSLNTRYNLVFTKSINYIVNNNFDEIISVFEIFDKNIFNLGIPIGLLNTESLNVDSRFSLLYNNYKNYPGIKYIYDYSLSNIRLMNNANITNTKYFPYLFNKKENTFLKEINTTTKKEYHYGIICSSGQTVGNNTTNTTKITGNITTIEPPRRNDILHNLILRKFNINVISGWGEARDLELAKCECILNIHGEYNNEPGKIFEHLRCNRLLDAGFKVLSEDSLHMDSKFVEEYPNLEFKSYSQLLDLKITKKKWVFYYKYYNVLSIEDYINHLNNDCYDVYLLNDKEQIKSLKPDKISMLINNWMYYSYDCIPDHNIFSEFPNTEISFLQLEPLNLSHRIDCIVRNKEIIGKYKIYDYSLSNIRVLMENGFNNCEQLPYVVTALEKTFLSTINKVKKEYTFGFINKKPSMPILPPRRNKILQFLIDNNYSLNIIAGWGEERDIELAKCEYIINLHGQLNEDPNSPPEVCSNIFEHIRCDRLLESGFKIISEESLYLDPNFIKKYPNLTIIKYMDFFNVSILNSIINQPVYPKIVDCFIFYNEITLLKYRLKVLWNVVDHFVIVESRQTFIGASKPLFFEENKDLFAEFMSKITHIVIDMPLKENEINIQNGETWINEKYQRNCIHEGIIRLNLDKDDLIIIADVDEIPDPKTLAEIKNNKLPVVINSLEQDFYYYNLECPMDHKWYYSKIMNYSVYSLNPKPDYHRQIRYQVIKNGGWHLSYFGDASFISNKIKNFSHQEYNTIEFTSIDNIQERISSKKDLYNRPRDNIIDLPFTENDYLPPYYYSILKKSKNVCFIHSCRIVQEDKEILLGILKKIINSNIYEHLQTIYINNLGIPIDREEFLEFEKVVITNYSSNTQLFEIPTINSMIEYSINNPESNILYLHTKGVSRRNTPVLPNIFDWSNLMLYFLLDKKCIKLLNEYDTLGCNLVLIPVLHYSGNFLWTRASYLKTLTPFPEENITIKNKNDPEFKILINNPKAYSLYDSGTNHYECSYPASKYS
jgi:beta-1,4-mannosyl-glycoprotein beta-1,4-N-acetylglucosaminyltransferase